MPHSEIHGSKLIRSSPRLFAAYHVLLRLCMPRHPPNALTTLNRSHCQCSSLTGSGQLALLACTRRATKSAIRTNLKSAEPEARLPFTTALFMMPLTCSTSLLYWSYAEQLTCSLSLRPASRDQIRDRAVRQRSSVIRQRYQRHQQRTTRVTDFPPTSDPSIISSRLDLQ